MNLLELVNGVLRRLREDTVQTIASDDYAMLIKDYVNDAKNFVESAWNWSGQRTTEGIPLVPGQANYDLTTLENYDIIEQLYNEVTGYPLQEITLNHMRQLQRTGGADGTPLYWCRTGAQNGVKQFAIFPVPTQPNVIQMDVIRKAPPLDTEMDSLVVPAQPVLYLAYAYAARERGEVQGQPTAELFALADKYMSDAIALDADAFPHDTTYRVV